MAKAKYETCPKCGLRHSTVVRHKCATPKKQKRKKMEAPDADAGGVGAGGETESTDKHPGADQGSGESKGEGGEQGKQGCGEGESQQGDGKGDQGDQNEAEGQGEGGQSDGEGEAEGETKTKGQSEGEQRQGKQGDGDGEDSEGEGQPPEPQLPDPEMPIVQVICTVLKFAALTAQCAKNGAIEVTLSDEGLMVYGHNGDIFAFDVMPWGEFEKRSTVDGEFYVKDIIDAVDAKLIDGGGQVERKPTPSLTLPMFIGQRVMCRDGVVREVKEFFHTSKDNCVLYKTGEAVFAWNEGSYALGGRGNAAKEEPWDALHDVE